jgi:hypothetical protein
VEAVNEHRAVYLPIDSADVLIANLNAFSREGWEFVTWLTDPLPRERLALLRRQVLTYQPK